MSDTKWTIRYSGEDSRGFATRSEIVTSRGECVARVDPGDAAYSADRKRWEYLIAAAPEMYDALAAIVETIDRLGTVNLPKMDAARAALAKARGETR